MDNQQQLEALFQKYLDRKCTEQEVRQLVAYFDVPQNETALKAAILEYFENRQEAQSHDPATEDRALAEVHKNLLAHIERRHPVRRLWPRIAAAASILLILSAGGYILLHKSPQQQIAQNQTNDVLPGTNHALLKIGHNRTVILDNAGKGLIAQQGNTAIIKTANGTVVYSGATASYEPVYDTLIVPAGAKPYHLTLADGSKLLVNVASKVRFPESFGNKERRIDMLGGEAFFEVSHDAARPLSVYVKGLIVKDLGTQFNIDAYDDEAVIKTTLTQGSLSVSKGDQTATLIPGQQAVTGRTGRVKIIKDANTEEALAWKDGMFRFDSTPLADIMKQVARWYDVEVVYQDDALKAKTFFAVSTRFAKVSTLLGNLEKIGGVKFKIEGKKIIVTNP